MPSEALAILGMHRSGTSLAARIIQLLGAELGDQDELELGGADNPDGFFERRPIHSIHERIFEALGVTWDTPQRLPDDWRQRDEITPLRDELSEYVRSEFHAPLSAWKDPRTSLLLPLWREVLDEADIGLKCLILVRHPLEVARSLERRDGFDTEHSLAVWLNYNLAAIENSAGLPRAVASYESLLEDWRETLQPCFEGLEIPWPPSAASLEAPIDPDLRHSRYEPGDLEPYHPSLLRLARELASDDLELAQGRLRQIGMLGFRLDA